MRVEDSKAPSNCPNCGKRAVAIILDGDSQTTSVRADESCEVSRHDLPREVGWVQKATYIHSGEN